MNKKYGLIWEDHPEPIEELLKTHHLSFEEVVERRLELGGEDSPQHLLIEGDNYESLMLLKEQFSGKVGVIYIDPPYNTKNKGFKYNDHYESHSKWLSFISRRLKLAKDLMSEDGVIFISIDDNEMAQLKLLCDEIFGEQNFISNISWHKGYGKNDSHFFRNTTEYILCYSKNISSLKKREIKFSSQKQGYQEICDIISNFKKAGLTDHKLLEKEIKSFYKSKKLKGISAYNKVEEDSLRVYSGVTLEDPKDSNYYYDVVHPLTKKVCKMPKKGWNRPRESMEELLKNGEILFGKDETTLPRRKYYLDKMENEIPHNFIENSSQGGSDIKSIFGENIFSFPKPLTLINYLLGLYPRKDSVILDFFAGSGTTGHAVLELNKQDGGNRQFILCTNNENNICEEITYERLNKVMNGYTTPKGKVVEGIPANLTYLKTKLEPKEGEHE